MNGIVRTKSRRWLLQGLALGGLALSPGLSAAADHPVEALLLTCMDYRLANEIAAYMDGRGLRDKYDHIVLAGASLGALTDQRPDWGRTFWQHLDVALELHHVKKVIVLDHQDCGAYRVFLGAAAVAEKPAELKVHGEHLRRLKAEILEKHPELQVELGIMALDGSVQTIA